MFICVKLIQISAEKLFSGRILKQLDRTLGFFFGLLEGCAVVALLCFVLQVQPWHDVSPLMQESLIYRELEQLLFEPLQPLIMHEL